jgi:hypothetical protein
MFGASATAPRFPRWVLSLLVVITLAACGGTSAAPTSSGATAAPRPRVPMLLGLSEQQALAALAALGVQGLREDGYDPSVPAGQVKAQAPGAGLPLDGLFVRYTVSDGPEPATSLDAGTPEPVDTALPFDAAAAYQALRDRLNPAINKANTAYLDGFGFAEDTSNLRKLLKLFTQYQTRFHAIPWPPENDTAAADTAHALSVLVNALKRAASARDSIQLLGRIVAVNAANDEFAASDETLLADLGLTP